MPRDERAYPGARSTRQGGALFIELLIELMVLAWLSVYAVTQLSLWAERQVAERTAAGANEIMAAVREYYDDGDVETERWPADPLGTDTRLDTLIDAGYLRGDINPHPYGGNYALGLINGGKLLTLTLTVDDPMMARFIALSIPEHGRAVDTTVTASMPRSNVHRSHDELVALDGSRPYTGTIPANGHALNNLREFTRIDDLAKVRITNPDHPEDVGYFPDDNDIAIAFAGTSTVIGRWPSGGGNAWKVTNTSTDTARNHIIPLRTEAEWLSFKDNLVPRTTELDVCEITDPLTESCTPSVVTPFITFTAASYRVRQNGRVTLTWGSGGYHSCEMKHLRGSWASATTNGSKRYRVTMGGSHVFRCTADDGSGKRQVSIRISVVVAHTHTPPWTPATSTVCSGTSFTQTATCSHTRSATGTKTNGKCGPSHTHTPPWTPSTSSKCSGTIFTQTAACGHTRSAVGRKSCSSPPSDPCDDASVTRYHSSVERWYSKVFKRGSDKTGLCYWSMAMRDGDWDEKLFVAGARGGVCPPGSPSGDCWLGSEYSKIWGKNEGLFSCTTCLTWTSQAQARCAGAGLSGGALNACASAEVRGLSRAYQAVEQRRELGCDGEKHCLAQQRTFWTQRLSEINDASRKACLKRGFNLNNHGVCLQENITELLAIDDG